MLKHKNYRYKKKASINLISLWLETGVVVASLLRLDADAAEVALSIVVRCELLFEAAVEVRFELNKARSGSAKLCWEGSAWSGTFERASLNEIDFGSDLTLTRPFDSLFTLCAGLGKIFLFRKFSFNITFLERKKLISRFQKNSNFWI